MAGLGVVLCYIVKACNYMWETVFPNTFWNGLLAVKGFPKNV